MQRRRTVRYVPKTAIAVQLLLDGYIAAYGEIEDISLDGARLAISETFPSTEEIELCLAAEERFALTFHSTARVVWSRPATRTDRQARWGVRWTRFPSAPKLVLKALIAATCKEA